MAMMMTAPISSNIASEVRNTLRLVGTLEPSRANIPSAKAISVAAGMAQPAIAALSPELK